MHILRHDFLINIVIFVAASASYTHINALLPPKFMKSIRQVNESGLNALTPVQN